MRRDARIAIAAESAPPPGPVLLAAVDGMNAVRPRSPRQAFAAIVIVAILYPAYLLWRLGPRSDLPAMSVAWVVGTAVAWAAAAALLLARAVLPPPGEVLPDAPRVGRTAGWTAAALVLLGLVATAEEPGSASLASFSRNWWRCASIGFYIVLPVLTAGGLMLRRLHPVGSGRVGSALGAAGGALAGLTLHFVCGIGSGLHVSLAHGGVSVLGGLLGALLLRPVLRA
jgi:phosphotransferase system  glucose/maltose/N-acetylglucosamine-specific IIC component